MVWSIYFWTDANMILLQLGQNFSGRGRQSRIYWVTLHSFHSGSCVHMKLTWWKEDVCCVLWGLRFMRKWQLQCKEQALQDVLKNMPTSTESDKTLQLDFRDTKKQNLDTWYICSVQLTALYIQDVHPQAEQVKIWNLVTKMEVSLTASC